MRSLLPVVALGAGLMLLILLSPYIVRADTITTFEVSGTAENDSGGTLASCLSRASCAFSGMFTVDTTNGTVESSGLDIALPGLTAFDDVIFSIQEGNDWEIGGVNSSLVVLNLLFTTAPHAGSLVGFTSGSIVGATSFVASHYNNLSGSITPVPEPSSLLLLAGGIAWLVFGPLIRKLL